MLELYHTLYSTCSQKVRLCLAEKGLDWIDHPVNLFREEHLAPTYLDLNPKGVVPTLIHDGRPVTESSAIVEYIDEVFPAPRLVPDNAYDRAITRAWMAYFNEIPTSYIRVPSVHAVFRTSATAIDAEVHLHNTERRPLRKFLMRKLSPSGFPDAEIVTAMDALCDTLRRIDKGLENHAWIAGDRLSLADILVIPVIDRLEDLALDQLWRDLPRVSDWWHRVKARPSHAAAYPPGSRLSDYMPDIAAIAHREVARVWGDRSVSSD